MNLKSVFLAFKQFMRNIWEDYMLVACLFAPILMGLIFKLLIPILESYLCSALNQSSVLSLYYSLFDLLLSLMTPLMLCFSGVMVVLEELDNGTAKYLMVNPLGKWGYLLSRIGILTLLSTVYNFLLVSFCKLSEITVPILLAAVITSAIISIQIAMFVIAFAKNKVEGMALLKFSGFLILGFFAAYFIKDMTGYLAGILPTFWTGKMVIDNNLLFLLPSIFVSLIWIYLLYQKFRNKLI